MELLGNGDVSALSDRKYEMVKDDVKQEMLKGTSWVDFVTFIVQSSSILFCVTRVQ